MQLVAEQPRPEGDQTERVERMQRGPRRHGLGKDGHAGERPGEAEQAAGQRHGGEQPAEKLGAGLGADLGNRGS